MIRSLELGKEQDNGMVRLRLQAVGNGETLKGALQALNCVKQVEAVPSDEEGTAAFSLVCVRADEKGRATDQVFRVLAQVNAPIREMREEKDSLEEVFLRETE
jgi:ABC-2 type transport system ATP-binding protein